MRRRSLRIQDLEISAIFYPRGLISLDVTSWISYRIITVQVSRKTLCPISTLSFPILIQELRYVPWTFLSVILTSIMGSSFVLTHWVMMLILIMRRLTLSKQNLQ